VGAGPSIHSRGKILILTSAWRWRGEKGTEKGTGHLLEANCLISLMRLFNSSEAISVVKTA